MSLPHALLGLLAVEPRSGYDLTKAFESDLGRYAWQAGHTSIYPELNRMATKGLVEVSSEGARGSRTYSVTPAGRDELRSWLMRPPDGNGRVRNAEVLRMFLLSTLEPDDALVMLRGIAQHTAEGAASLREIRERTADIPVHGKEGFGLLAAEFGLRQLEAVNSWALWAIEQVESGRDDASRGGSHGESG